MQLTAAAVFLALSLSTSTLAAPASTNSGDAYAVCYSLDECYYLDSDYGNQYGQSGPGPFSYSDVAAAGESYGYPNGGDNDTADENDTTNDDTTTNDNDNDNENENDNGNENNNGRRDIHDASRHHPWFLHPHRHHKNNRRALPIGANANAGLNVTASANTNTNYANGVKCCSELVDVSRILSGVTTDAEGKVSGVTTDAEGILSGLLRAVGSTSAGLNFSGNGGANVSARALPAVLAGLTLGVNCKAVSGTNAQCKGTLATCTGGILNINGLTQKLNGVATLGCKAKTSN